MRVQSDLLLFTSSWVHVVVGVQIATVSIVVTDAYPAAKNHISRDILHLLRIKRGLKLWGHESIAVAWVYQANKMDGEQSHVEGNWDNDQTEYTRQKMLRP